MRAAAFALLTLLACDKPQQPSPAPTTMPPPPAPTVTATGAPTATASATPTTSATPTPTASTASSASSPSPQGAAVSATGRRSERAAKDIAQCKSPPPVACTKDSECTTFEIATWDGPCASTLKAGITAAKKAEYVASSPCVIAGPAHPPSCVVHWVRAEDGPPTPPAQTTIAARCVRNACLSQYVAATQ